MTWRVVENVSIRLLAIEVYNAMKRIKALEDQFESMPLDDPAREDTKARLNREKAELARIKMLLDGAKG